MEGHYEGIIKKDNLEIPKEIIEETTEQRFNPMLHDSQQLSSDDEYKAKFPSSSVKVPGKDGYLAD